jgi:hypothetical protein
MDANKNNLLSFIPQLLFASGLLIWSGFQTIVLLQESRQLTAAKANQESTVQQATKVRAQLDSIAAKTQVLADKGNNGAKTIVDELKKRGITINPNAKPSGEPSAASPAVK